MTTTSSPSSPGRRRRRSRRPSRAAGSSTARPRSSPSASPPNLQVTPTDQLAGGLRLLAHTGARRRHHRHVRRLHRTRRRAPTASPSPSPTRASPRPPHSATTGAVKGSRGSTGSRVSLDHWKNDTDPSSNFVGIATTSPTAAVAQLRHHELVDPVVAQLDAPLRRDDGSRPVSACRWTASRCSTTRPSCLRTCSSDSPAATGGFNDIHQIQNVAITAGPPPPVPTVTGISPTSGPSTGGTTVTITGTGLTSASAVNFGATPATTFLLPERHARSPPPRPPASSAPSTSRSRRPGARPRPARPTSSPTSVPPVPTVTGVSPGFGTEHGRDHGDPHRHRTDRRVGDQLRRGQPGHLLHCRPAPRR